MEKQKFQFLGLLGFGILIMLVGLFSSVSNFPVTSYAVSNLGSGTFFGLTVGVFLLVLLSFYRLR